MKKIYLIRHGRQNSPLCNVDVPLDEAGVRQAELVAERLKLYNIDRLYSSNLIRAKETAAVISERLNIENNIEKDLREICFGDLEGLSKDEISERFGDFIRERNMALTDVPYPNGESGQDVYIRVEPVLEKIVEKALTEGDENIAVVTHGGVIRSVVAGILEADFAKKLWVAKDLENCSITEIIYDEDNKRFIVERVNDYAHIEAEPYLMRKHFSRSL